MRLPGFIYRSERIGKNGKPFSLYKFRTLKEGFDGNFATNEGYTRFGKFLRKTKLDELPQLMNWLRGDIALVGPRPELPETIGLIPRDIKQIITSVKPGLTSLASITFINEEELLKKNGVNIYYQKIKSIKLILDCFYVEHKDFLLDFWIIYKTVILIVKNLFRK